MTAIFLSSQALLPLPPTRQEEFPSPLQETSASALPGRELLRELFLHNWGAADFLDNRLILLNKIAGMDRRDQVILDGRHIATLWFDITEDRQRLDLEIAGAALLKERAKKNLVICHESLLKGHIKGKWLARDQIISPLPLSGGGREPGAQDREVLCSGNCTPERRWPGDQDQGCNPE